MAPEPPEPDESTWLSALDPESQADSLHQFPSVLVSPLPDALMAKFCSIVPDEITTASRKLSSDLERGLKELGHRSNQLKQRMDLATTALKGHEEEVERMTVELQNMQDK